MFKFKKIIDFSSYALHRNLMSFLIFVFNFSLLPFDLDAQSITWQKVYDLGSLDDEANGICQSVDGNFYVVGYAHGFNTNNVLKINGYGDTLWKKNINVFNFLAVVPTNDGGCVLTGYSDTSFTIKLSSSGSLIWRKKYSGPYYSASFNSLFQTSNGFFIATGNNFSSGGIAMKVDSNGNLIWQRRYSKIDYIDFNSIIEADDGRYIISGIVYENNIWKAYLLKIDTAGNPVWEKRFLPSSYTTGRRVTKILNGYIIAGTTVTNNTKTPYILKTNLNGDSVFLKTLQYSDDEYLNDFKILSSNRYVLSCHSDISIDSSARVLITDSTGNIIYHRFFTYGEFAQFHEIQTVTNGDIIFAGSAEPPNGYWYDTYIVRTDSNLNAPPIGIKYEFTEIPNNFILEQNYPNPFNPTTVISYQLSVISYTKIIIYDVLGREVVILVSEHLKPGKYEVEFNGLNYPSGVYFYRLITDGYRQTKKMILLK